MLFSVIVPRVPLAAPRVKLPSVGVAVTERVETFDDAAPTIKTPALDGKVGST